MSVLIEASHLVRDVQGAVTKLRSLFEDDDEEALACVWAAESALSDLLEIVGKRKERQR